MDIISEQIKQLEQIIIGLDDEIYVGKKSEAKRRIQDRDVHDWPIVACALTLNCPIWTEDQDFFGTGIPIWNSRNIEIFLSE